MISICRKYGGTMPLLAAIFFLLLLSGCAQYQNGVWREPHFGVTVRSREVTLANGTVADEWISGDYSNAQKSQLNDDIVGAYNVTKLRDATTKYNCHSYAWYSQSINNIYWIGDPTNFRTNWITSTGWTNIIPSTVQNGDRVDYYKSDSDRPHSAVVWSTATNLFVSKWGTCGLYVHLPTECPNKYRSNQLGYYRP